jgi:hypothetical protein
MTPLPFTIVALLLTLTPGARGEDAPAGPTTIMPRPSRPSWQVVSRSPVVVARVKRGRSVRRCGRSAGRQ